MTDAANDSNVEYEDYEYDLAHEELEARQAERPAPPLPQPASMHVHDDGGDYGYDAAHDQV
jgi:hypothetical protein